VLARYEQLTAEIERDLTPDPATPQFCNYATLQRGLSFERHVIAWCDWLLGALTSADQSAPEDGTSSVAQARRSTPP